MRRSAVLSVLRRFNFLMMRRRSGSFSSQYLARASFAPLYACPLPAVCICHQRAARNPLCRFAYVPNYTNYTATKGDVALVAQVVRVECNRIW